jgi:perosamine synthetase
MIGYGKQTISQDDVEAVSRAIKDDYLTCGPRIAEFEQKFASYVGAKYAVAVSNGTAALHLSAIAAGLMQGDEVITTPMTFAATANSVIYCQAKPVFADICGSGHIDPGKITSKITKRTRAIIPVDYAGEPCDMHAIVQIAQKYGLKIIRDACHALGATDDGQQVGSCSHGETTVFSFHPVKHITTGEGGIITTSSKEEYERLKRLRHHGIDTTNHPKDEPWRSDMQELGFNYRLTDFQCALGISQLKRADEFLRKRREIAARYDDAFAKSAFIEMLKRRQNTTHAYHLYVIKLRTASMRLKLYEHLKSHGILCQVHYIPVYRHSYYAKLDYMADCPMSEDFYSRVLSLPIFPGLGEKEQARIISLINGRWTDDPTD